MRAVRAFSTMACSAVISLLLHGHSMAAPAVIQEAQIGEVATGVRNNEIASRALNIIIADAKPDIRSDGQRRRLTSCSQRLMQDVLDTFKLIDDRTKTITDLEEEAIRRAPDGQRPSPDLARDD